MSVISFHYSHHNQTGLTTGCIPKTQMVGLPVHAGTLPPVLPIVHHLLTDHYNIKDSTATPSKHKGQDDCIICTPTLAGSARECKEVPLKKNLPYQNHFFVYVVYFVYKELFAVYSTLLRKRSRGCSTYKRSLCT